LFVSKYKVYKVDSSLNTTKFFTSYWWNSAINYRVFNLKVDR